MYTKKQKSLAILACATVILIIFFSAFLTVKEADHDCTGENCPICACIRQAEQMLRQIGSGRVEALNFAAAAMLLICLLPIVFRTAFCISLVSRKVRLND